MTRALAKSGRANTEIFPESGKELARLIGLTENIYILKASIKDDGGGSYETIYRKVSPPVRARVDSYKRIKPRGVIASKIDEFTNHLFVVDKDTDIDPPDRIERAVDNSVWKILAVEHRTDQPTIQVLAKEMTAGDS